MLDNDVHWMNYALNKAREALQNDEVPVGCILVDENDEILVSAHNDVNRTKNPNRHAEIVALEEIYKIYQNNISEKISKCKLYVTSEPCIMCCTAWRAIGIQHIIYGAPNNRFGGCGSILDVARCSPFSMSLDTSHPLYPNIISNIKGNVCGDEALSLLKEFYSKGNPRTMSLGCRKRKK